MIRLGPGATAAISRNLEWFQEWLNSAWYHLRDGEDGGMELVDARNGYDAQFLREHWHPIPQEWASGINPALVHAAGEDGEFFLCDMWDPDTKLCTAHATRPPVCRSFPWYGEDPGKSERTLTPWPHCSFWLDVPAEKAVVNFQV